MISKQDKLRWKTLDETIFIMIIEKDEINFRTTTRSSLSRRSRSSNACETRPRATAEAEKKNVHWQYAKLEIQKKVCQYLAALPTASVYTSATSVDHRENTPVTVISITPYSASWQQHSVHSCCIWNSQSKTKCTQTISHTFFSIVCSNNDADIVHPALFSSWSAQHYESNRFGL